jgi:hypothetical protein
MNPTVKAMHTYGGSFVRALAAAWGKADPTNRERLETAFKDYFGRYEELARKLAAEKS